MNATDEGKGTLRSKLARKQLVGVRTEGWNEPVEAAKPAVRATAKIGDKGRPAVRPTA